MDVDSNPEVLTVDRRIIRLSEREAVECERIDEA